MDNTELHSKLQDYVAWSHLWHKLDSAYPREDLNDLMLKLTFTEKEILIHFGLPHTFQYSELFQNLGLKEDFKLSDIDDLLEEIRETAEIYLTGQVITDIDLVRMAQKHALDIEEVLPELSFKLDIEPYYIYIYINFLLADLMSAEDFLEELKIIQVNDLSHRLNLVSQNKSLMLEEEYKELLGYNLKCFEDFLENYNGIDELIIELKELFAHPAKRR